MHWQWLTGPSAGFMAAALVVQQVHPGVSDELERVISILVPLVAALLSPLVAAVVYLAKLIVSELREGRNAAASISRVVTTNTAAFDGNTKATDRLATVVEALSKRLERLEQRIEHMEQGREHRGHLGGPTA